MLRPRPEPLPTSLVVKNGSNTLLQDAGGNAVPGIGHRDHHVIPGGDIAVGAGVVLVEATLPVSMVSLPPSGIASRALSARLRIALVSWLGSISACDVSPASIMWTSICSPSVGRSRLAASITSVDVDLARLQRLLAGEREQALGQIGAARGGVVDHLRDRQQLRPVRDGFGEDFDRAGDDGENIVEVVRDAAGQLTDRFHFLGLAKLQIRDILLVKQAVLFLDQGLHPIDGDLQRRPPGGGRDRFGQHVGESR